jgi:FkbM family methyltransferase
MTTLADETRVAAANIEHEWDRRAIDWPLTGDSVVVEVGGYKGRWALQIAERYHPRLYVFEPQPWAAEVCREVLGDRAMVMRSALGTHTCLIAADRWGTDGCSLVGSTDGPKVQMREIGEVFEFLDLAHIDLMLMNIEGYEYMLIPHMLDRGLLPQRLMVQFHIFADPDGSKGVAIFDRLARLGYTAAWTYGEVLTAWERITNRP